MSINAGSSSLKFSLFEMDTKEVLVSGLFERIGIEGSMYTIKYQDMKIKENNVELENRQYHYITVYEEVGHGGAASIPNGVTEMISVDMGCVGEGLSCDEHKVSICVKDSRGPYNYDVVTGLVKAAKENDIKFALDVYPHPVHLKRCSLLSRMDLSLRPHLGQV